MAFPGIGKALKALGGLYARWKGAEFAIETLDGDGDASAGIGSIKTDMPGRAIEWVDYNLVTSKMVVRFKNRSRYPAYVYSRVPRLVWLGWLSAGSKGGYFHQRVKQHSDLLR